MTWRTAFKVLALETAAAGLVVVAVCVWAAWGTQPPRKAYR